MMHMPGKGSKAAVREVPSIPRIFAWTPPLLPIALIVLGLVFKEASFVGDPNIALLIGALVSLGMAREKSGAIISSASRRAGVIIFDLCGAGALGFVIAQSDLGLVMLSSFGQVLPLMVAPFLITALIQLAQGSRVVTVVIAADILKGYPLDGLPLAFLIAAGAFMFSYVSDPYFWLVRETTNSGLKEMVRGYTLPLSICGAVAFAVVLLLFHG
jgi:GntP family gluconate:H+ symporter